MSQKAFHIQICLREAPIQIFFLRLILFFITESNCCLEILSIKFRCDFQRFTDWIVIYFSSAKILYLTSDILKRSLSCHLRIPPLFEYLREYLLQTKISSFFRRQPCIYCYKSLVLCIDLNYRMSSENVIYTFTVH